MAAVTDFHTHVVPEAFPPAPGDEPAWPSMRRTSDTGADVMIAGRVFRSIDHRSWDGAVRIADMDRDGIGMQVLSPMPELLSYWFAPAAGSRICAHLNAAMAALMAAHPGRFAAYGAVPLQAPDLAAAELRALRAAGFSGVEIGSHVNGRALGDPALAPFWEAAEAEGMVVMIHALYPAGIERVGAGPDVAGSLFPIETALAALSLIAGGVLERHPGLRLMLSHGAGALPLLLPRLAQSQRLLAPPHLAHCGAIADLAAGRLYADSIVYDPRSLRYVAEMLGIGQVVMGSDYPFAVMQADPAGFVRAALGPEAAGVLARRPDLTDPPGPRARRPAP